jgi:hypothetical protein
MPTPRLAVTAVGYLPQGAETLPRGEIDSIVWLVFIEHKRGWKVASIWLTEAAAYKAAGKHKCRQVKVISVYVPGLLLTAVTKLRTAE